MPFQRSSRVEFDDTGKHFENDAPRLRLQSSVQTIISFS